MEYTITFCDLSNGGERNCLKFGNDKSKALATLKNIKNNKNFACVELNTYYEEISMNNESTDKMV